MNRLIMITLLMLTILATRAQQVFPPGAVIGGNDGLSGFLFLNSRDLNIQVNKKVNQKDIIELFSRENRYGKLNFFILKNSPDLPDFTAATQLTTYKEINDSLYEIYIRQPGNEVIFAYKLSDGYWVAFKGTHSGGMNSPDIMGGGLDSLLVENQDGIERYKVMPYNPFLYGAEIFIQDKEAADAHKQLITFRILYQFPSPRLIAVTSDTMFIERKKENPSFRYFNPAGSDTSHDTLFSKVSNTILFVFDHFAEKYRLGNLDNLMYKFDDAQDWALTPLAHTPSILLENIPVGKHTLYVKYPVSEAIILAYSFEIKPDWTDSPVLFILLCTCLGALMLGLFFSMRLRRIKAKLQKTKLDLQAIQAQLNPHFMFNALASIQYLVHHDKESADLYLTEFSNLLRHSLYNTEKEMVPLSVELQTLDSYIQLERLRFHFVYQKTIDEKIEPDTINIPALLIQPLIENAIKHGIAALQQNGYLCLGITKKNKDIEITIADNGKGFAGQRTNAGLGLKLVKERIAVLKKQKMNILLSFHSNQKDQTIATIVLKNWC